MLGHPSFLTLINDTTMYPNTQAKILDFLVPPLPRLSLWIYQDVLLPTNIYSWDNPCFPFPFLTPQRSHHHLLPEYAKSHPASLNLPWTILLKDLIKREIVYVHCMHLMFLNGFLFYSLESELFSQPCLQCAGPWATLTFPLYSLRTFSASSCPERT